MKSIGYLLLLFLLSSKVLRANPQCHSRSLISTSRVELVVEGGWSLYAKKAGGLVSCHATKKNQKKEITLIYSPVSKYRKHNWYIGLLSREFSLPEGTNEVPGYLLGPENKMMGIGKLLRLVGMKNGKEVPGNVRFEFLSNDLTHFELVDRIKIITNHENVKEIPLLPFKQILHKMRRCYDDATGKEKEDFWKKSTSHCG